MNTLFPYTTLFRSMLEVLGLTGISNISTTPLTTATARPDGSGNIIITLDGTDNGSAGTSDNASAAPSNASAADIITVYDTTGRIVRRTAINATADTHTPITIPAQDLHGIFVVQIGHRGSTIIRL